ncbi:MAG: S41 family peptidase [Thermoplasmata archaeon]
MKHYLMSPDISGNKITFIWNDDLWIVEGNSPAVRLTNKMGIVTNSRFSPDGKYVAFRVEQGVDGSSADIYTINLEDGKIKRITYLGGKSTSRRMYTDIAGWTPSGEVVVSTDAYSPFTAMTELYSIDPKGGVLTKLPYGPGSHILFTRKGVVIARHATDMPHWKHYRGGTSGVLWASGKTGKFKKIVDLNNHLSSPFYIDGRIYFVTDVNGTGNLYSVDENGKEMKQHTNFDKYYVRNTKSDGLRGVFQMGGEIYLFDPKSNNTKLIVPRIISSTDNVDEKYPNASTYIEQFSPDFTGDNITITVRGRGFTSPFENGFVFEAGNSGERVKVATLISSSELLYVSDKKGEENLYLLELRNSSSYEIAFSRGIVEWLMPDRSGKNIAVSNNRGELFLIKRLGTEKAKTEIIDKSDEGVVSNPVWSPDGKLLAYSVPIKATIGRGPSSVIRVYSEREKKAYDVTETGSYDYSPSFSIDGKFLYFLSDRNLDPTADSFVFDLSFQTTCMPMVIPLDASSSKKLDNLPNEQGGTEGTRKEIEWFPPEELKNQARSLKLKPSNYESIAACIDGVLLLEFPVEGMSKYGLFGGSPRLGKLIKYDPISGREDLVREDVASFVLSGDGKVAIVKDKESNLIKINVEHVEKARDSERSEKKFDLKRIKLKVTPKDEWTQMFLEAKRLVRENYWNEKKLREKYESAFKKYDNLLPRLSSRFELSDVLREFQGEFATSHSYEVGGDLSDAKTVPTGKLGMDLKYENGKYFIKRILKANLTNEGEKSPALLASVPLKEGDIILSINSLQLGEENTVEKALLNRTDEFVSVIIERNGRKLTSYIKTVADDRRLRYREWVERNREIVHRKTNDKVGYIHIPDMGSAGFSEFARLYPIESKKDALIVDVRYNGGGFVSQLLLEKLAKRRIGYDIPRRGEIQPYPAYTINGPMVELVDENAGSDGDIFTHSFKLFGLGPVIGKRTWGGVIGINPRHTLVDGTIVTQPEFAFWFKDVGFGVENYGTDPTMEVEITPEEWGEGRDTQLEKGIDVVLKLMKKYEGRVKFKE